MSRSLPLALLLCIAAASPALSAPVQCPATGHYYEIVASLNTWGEADSIAQTMSHLGFPGHLATITSADEQSWFTSFLVTDSPNNHLHIGGFQDPGGAEPAGGWQWVTGEPMTYTNWYPGEPNQYQNANEDNIFVYKGSVAEKGQWADGVGSAARWFAVEYDYEPPVPAEVSSWGALKAREGTVPR